jgi:hypothetical protein
VGARPAHVHGDDTGGAGAAARPGRPSAAAAERRRRAALAAAAVVTLAGGASLAALLTYAPATSTGSMAALAPIRGFLDGAAGISATSTWAAGASCVSGCGTASPIYRTLIVRRDRSSWSRVASPSPGQNAELYSVSAGPGGSAWAAGYSCCTSAGNETLILRWNGTSWSRTPSPGRNAVLEGVSAGPGGRAWAAGYSCASRCGTASEVDRTLILRWNRGSWSRAASPSPGQIARLNSVSAGPGGSAWAAGTSCASHCRTASEVARTLVLRFNGASWSRKASPSPGQRAVLWGVTAGPGGSAWAAGVSCVSHCGTASEVDRTLILRWDGFGWATG